MTSSRAFAFNSSLPPMAVASTHADASPHALSGRLPTQAERELLAAGQLANLVGILQAGTQRLLDPSVFSTRSVNSSMPTVATANATHATPERAFSLRVDQLAQAQTMATATPKSRRMPIGSGAPADIAVAFARGGGFAERIVAALQAFRREDVGGRGTSASAGRDRSDRYDPASQRGLP